MTSFTGYWLTRGRPHCRALAEQLLQSVGCCSEPGIGSTNRPNDGRRLAGLANCDGQDVPLGAWPDGRKPLRTLVRVQALRLRDATSPRCESDREDRRRLAEFLGEPDKKSSGPTDVAEPIRVFVLDHFAADELRAALAEPGERIVDVVHGEHDA